MEKTKRPDDVLSAGRYRFPDEQHRSVYVTIADHHDSKTPCEVWITLPDENKPSQQALRTDITVAAALFSLARKSGASFTETLDAMEGACYSKQAISAKLVEVLIRHCSREKAAMMEFEAASRKAYGAAVDASNLKKVEEVLT